MSTSGVAEADQHHGRRGHADGRPGGYGEQGRRPQQNADAEVEGEPAALREDESDEAADEAADPHDSVEIADSGASEVEQVERERHDEDERGARDDGLRAVHADDEPQVAVAENGPEPRARVAEKRPTFIVRRFLRACDRRRLEPDDERRRPQERGRVHDVHRLNVGHGEQEAAQRRAEEEADALDRARRDVGGGELAGIARQAREAAPPAQGGSTCLRAPSRSRARRRPADGPSAAITPAATSTSAARRTSETSITHLRG